MRRVHVFSFPCLLPLIIPSQDWFGYSDRVGVATVFKFPLMLPVYLRRSFYFASCLKPFGKAFPWLVP